MRKSRGRPVFHEQLGRHLATLRGAKGWSVQQAIIQSRGKGRAALTENKLRWLEEGKTKLPDPEVLRAVADIYGLEYLWLAKQFVAASYGSDLVRHAGDQGSGTKEANGATERDPFPELAALRTENETLKTRLAAIEDVAGELVGIASGSQDASARRRATKHRRSRRATS